MSRPPRPSLTRIAQDLNVSAKTVSNAFNHPDQLSAALRERILMHAASLGYPGPDPLARAFRSGSSGVIGVVYLSPLTHAFADQAFVRFLNGLAAVLEPTRKHLLLLPGGTSVVDALMDGAVVYSISTANQALADLAARQIPFVTVDQPELPGVPWVGIDDRVAARSLAEHLRDEGHERIGILSFTLTHDAHPRTFTLGNHPAANLPVTGARLDGFAEVFPADTPVIQTYGSAEAGAEIAARELFTAHPEITALACFADRMALGAMRAATSLGRNVPSDLAITGFDDVLSPADDLTSVAQPHEEKGRLGAEALLALLAGESAPDRQMLPTTLNVRGSSRRRS